MRIKYDVYHDLVVPVVRPHFCGEVGCDGSKPGHGVSFESACEEVARFYDQHAENWRSLTEQEFWELEHNHEQDEDTDPGLS